MKKGLSEFAQRWLCGWFITIVIGDIAGVVLLILGIFGIIH